MPRVRRTHFIIPARKGVIVEDDVAVQYVKVFGALVQMRGINGARRHAHQRSDCAGGGIHEQALDFDAGQQLVPAPVGSAANDGDHGSNGLSAL